MIILLLAFGLRVHRLEAQSVWWDEGLAAWAARQDLVSSALWCASDVHPPLYFWMLHFWRLGSGDSEFGLRFLSVGYGVLAVAALYRLGQALADRPTGILAALLLATARFALWWSQEMRMYILAALLATLSLWGLVGIWRRGRVRDWVLYVVSTLAALYTLYLSASILLIENLFVLLLLRRRPDRRRFLLNWATAQIAILLAFLPWLILALQRMRTWSSTQPFEFGAFLRLYWTVLSVGIPVDVEKYLSQTGLVALVFVLGLGAVVWTARRETYTRLGLLLLLLCLILPPLVVYLVSLPRSLFYAPQITPRYLLIFAPTFYLALAWGLRSLGRRHWIIALIPALAVGWVFHFGLENYFSGRYLLDDYKSLAATLRAYYHPGDAVVLYTDMDWPVFTYHWAGPWKGVPNPIQYSAQAAEEFLQPIWNDAEGVWLVVTPYAGSSDPQRNIPAWLESRARHVECFRFENEDLCLYARTPERERTALTLASPDIPHPMHVNLENGLALVGYEQAITRFQSGDVVHLFLYWQGTAAAHAEVGLVDVTGQAHEIVRVEVNPARWGGEDIGRTQVDLVITQRVPSGEYAFALRAEGEQEWGVRFGKAAVRRTRKPGLSPAEVTISHPLNLVLGGRIRLLGYDLEATIYHPGDTVNLTLYWLADEPVGQRYKVFTHLLGETYNPASGNFLWGQWDSEPVGGKRPTTLWLPGEVIVDEYAIPLSAQAPPGRYQVEVGMYWGASGERLLVTDDLGQPLGDHIMLEELQVIP
ncbi:MAG: glycosyltransferase family 39 protein [Anaerolineae bacterium]|jgi:4-amino-4-deoxy-L-arabinose transferase-like glycosyltransferase|nr:glycosyltransferase family 39 protein [Anaerolineae bacterium]MDH7473427.1 glycosyltransferase family 39 protein [Anaerolineae bacterium]